MNTLNITPLSQFQHLTDEECDEIFKNNPEHAYGVYKDEDKNLWLYNRAYQPMLKWDVKTTKVELVSRDTWVNQIQEQYYFFDDSTSDEERKAITLFVFGQWLKNIPVLPDELAIGEMYVR